MNCIIIVMAVVAHTVEPLRVHHISGAISRSKRELMMTAVDEEQIAQNVALWCMSSPGRKGAEVILSDASTTAEALRDFWSVADDMGSSDESVQSVIAFPYWNHAARDPQYFQVALRHLHACSEVCEHVGDHILVTARHPIAKPADDEPIAAPYPLLILRSLEQRAGFASDDPFGSSSIFGDDDPFSLGDGTEANLQDMSDDEIIAQTHKWVDAVIVHMKVCPFSSSIEKAGMPVGGVAYVICRAKSAEGVYSSFWNEAVMLANTDERKVATVLLLTPLFAQYNAGGYDALADTLNSALSELGFASDLQLVFFHPG